ncbi:MAG: deoxyribodipyrimidine photolyase [Proteobacteria bacterium]|nr:deoxyribodipyrimidine photolyase [Pseudomonadota bacterium]
MTTALVWFRRDLRLADNDALTHALMTALRVVPVYIHAPEEDGDWAAGVASRWWLHHSLVALSESLAQRGSRLVIRRGPSVTALRQLIRDTCATLVCFNRLYEPARLEHDRNIEQALAADDVQVYAGQGHLLTEPWAIESQSGTPYRVYTPYARRVRATLTVPAPQPAPRALPLSPARLKSLPLKELSLLPRIRWDTGLASNWQPGEDGAAQRLRRLASLLPDYTRTRDVPGVDGTTRLAPHLHFGEVSPRQVWRAIAQTASRQTAGMLRGAEMLERELLWREFAQHVLHHFPHTPEAPLNPRFIGFPWRRAPKLLAAWARWFWDTLVDADLASNTLNWQWVAGCGADAAPYFRIFNPVLQSRKFDAQGEYLRCWLPELAQLPDRHIHEPWRATESVLHAGGVRLGKDYPAPVLDLSTARSAALARWRDPTRRR